MDLSIILINHNTLELIKETIDSILKTVKNLNYEIIVVDNSDDECEKLESNNNKIKVISSNNEGFSKGCNKGAKEALGDYLLFLNSDSILKEGTINASFEYMSKDETIGTLGVRQLLQNGKLDHGCKRGFPTPMSSLFYFMKLDRLFKNSKLFGRYRQTYIDEMSVADVDSISGAYMLIKKEVFKRVGGFSEDYFMYGEDVDLCYKIKEAGLRVVYYGKVSFVHIKGQSGINNEFILENFYKSMRIFYDKHYKNKYSKLTTKLVYFGIDKKYGLAKKKLQARLKDR